jgi:glycosyltransferase involved in cell wall biosynthesis
MARWRIGLVVPRYGEDLLGGAERATQNLAEQLVASDVAQVQVLTTCARDHLTWQNELPAREMLTHNVPVRRFPVAHGLRDAARYNALHLRWMHQHVLSADEQHEWVNQSAHSPELYAYIETRGQTFDFLVFGPYFSGTTLYGSAIYPERSILWLHLHDEIYARLRPLHEMYRACRGVMFNTYPESRLAQRLYGVHPGGQIIGEIVSVAMPSPNGEQFRKQYNLREPFILYAGRLERGKNIALLVEYFLKYKRQRGGATKLALIGWGPEKIPRHSDIISLGLVNEQAKWDAYAAATLLCQPSLNESFSIVMMEAWLSGAPVLVHADCDVTRFSVVQSNGGLYFRDYDEFEAALDVLLTDDQLRRRMGENGKRYVQAEYSADAVLERFETALQHWSAREQGK